MPNDSTPTPSDKGASYNEGTSDPSNSLTTRKRRLTQICYERADTLERAVRTGKGEQAWPETKVTSNKQRREINEALSRLAEKAKVVTDGLRPDQIYIESLRALTVWNEQGKPDLSAAEKDADAARLAVLSDAIDKKAKALRQAEYAAKFETPKETAESTKTGTTGRAPKAKSAKRGRHLYTITVNNDSMHILGLVKGDEAEVYEADDLKPGDACALDVKGRTYAKGGRVVTIDAEQITIKNDWGVETINRADIISAGRIDHLNPGKTDPLSEADRERVNKLRKRLDRLGGEDDQIIRCTARYEIEKQIFDIEHPREELDDWGAWEEKGGTDGNG